MRKSRHSPASRSARPKNPPRRRRSKRLEQRERILRERVAYMLWVMANRMDGPA
jgi:hypothetical protein